MNTQHTPTPWKVDGMDVVSPSEMIVVGCLQWCGEDRGGEGEANAAFIVKACNAHDELVAALRDVVDTCDSGDYYGAPSAGAMQLARDALAKVGAL